MTQEFAPCPFTAEHHAAPPPRRPARRRTGTAWSRPAADRWVTALGESDASLFLARFALLAITQLGDAQASLRLVDDAARGLAPTANP